MPPRPPRTSALHGRNRLLLPALGAGLVLAVVGASSASSAISTYGPTATPSSSASSAASATATPASTAVVAEAEHAFRDGGAVVDAAGTAVGGLSEAGARLVFTVDVARSGDLATAVSYDTSRATGVTLSVNGLAPTTLALPADTDAAWTVLHFRSGLNTVTLRSTGAGASDLSVDALNVTGARAPAADGATVPYTTYEAEHGTTNGSVEAADRTFGTMAAEASRRQYVTLDATGEHVDITLSEPANALTLRYAIPDGTDGDGLDSTLGLYVGGSRVESLDLTSDYAWVYGSYPYTNDPSDGSAHHFFDDVRVQLGRMLPAGTTIRLQKDARDTAAWYALDLVEAEQVDAAYDRPAGSVSVTASGAVADDGRDDTAAIAAAVQAARAAGEVLWIPAGTFEITRTIDVTGVTVRGAGPWYSVLHGKDGKGGLSAQGGDTRIRDLAIFGDVDHRDDSGTDPGIGGSFGTGSAIANVWIEHVKVGLWVDTRTDGLPVSGLRIRNTFADGVNLHSDPRNVVLEQSSVRNTGDDALAMWSDGGAGVANVFRFNTVQVPLLGNAVGVYGGTGNRVEDNLLSDTVVSAAGIAVSSRFDPVPFAGTTVVARNTLARTGGYEPGWRTELGALWIYADSSQLTAPVRIEDNTVRDSTFASVLISGQKDFRTLSFDGDVLEGGTHGIEVEATGAATFTDVTISGTSSWPVVSEGGFDIAPVDSLGFS